MDQAILNKKLQAVCRITNVDGYNYSYENINGVLYISWYESLIDSSAVEKTLSHCRQYMPELDWVTVDLEGSKVGVTCKEKGTCEIGLLD